MKRCFMAVCAIATAVALSGCGQRDGEQFLGKWENAKRKETVEITKNGDSFLVADTHPNFAFGGLQTDKIPATYQSGVLQVATGFGTMNIGYDKAHDLLLMPTMGGTAELTRVK